MAKSQKSSLIEDIKLPICLFIGLAALSFGGAILLGWPESVPDSILIGNALLYFAIEGTLLALWGLSGVSGNPVVDVIFFFFGITEACFAVGIFNMTPTLSALALITGVAIIAKSLLYLLRGLVESVTVIKVFTLITAILCFIGGVLFLTIDFKAAFILYGISIGIAMVILAFASIGKRSLAKK